MRAVLLHRQQLQQVSGDLLRALDSVVGDLNTQPLCVGASQIWSGTGSPEGIVLGSIGDLYLRTDGDSATGLYRKATGIRTATGWIATVQNVSWTPVDGSGAGLVFPVAFGERSRIGDRVHFTAQVTYPATASGASAVLDGLGVTSTAVHTAVTIGFQTGGPAALQARVAAASALLRFSIAVTGAAATNAQLTGAILVVSGSYRAAT